MDPLNLSTPGASFFTSPDAHAVLERDILPAYVPGCRWFGGKARDPQRFIVEDMLPFSAEETGARLLLVRAEYASGEPETYLLPLLVGSPEGAPDFAVIATFSDGLALLDALEDAERRADLFRLMRTEAKFRGERGEISGQRGSALDPQSDLESKSRYLKVEQSNSSVAYGEKIFLKLFRKPDNGINPDVEITRFLSEKAHYGNIPLFFGSIEYHLAGAEPRVLGLAVGMVVNRGDAWSYALDEVGQYFGRLPQDKSEPRQAVADSQMGQCGERIAQLARRTAEVHLALASNPADPIFAPEPIAAGDQRELSEGVRKSAAEMFSLLRKQRAEGETEEELIDALLEQEAALAALAGEIAAREIHAAKTRTHGDYHLGQVLYTGDDFIIIDFEGEPRRTLAERKAKRSPLRDVAGMLRSFHYAAHSALDRVDPADRHEFEPWGGFWAAAASRIFTETWLATCQGAPFLPADRADIDRLLNAYLLEKAIYEVMYEVNHRPAWVSIPVRGVLSIVRPIAPVEENEDAPL